MLNKFNAWVDPWIPIEKDDGTTLSAGIYEVLKDAHNIRAVRAATPTESFGIQRLLITVLTDIYMPKRLEDLDNIYEAGSFIESKLSAYYNMCLAEGACFDLFDEKRPFLQYAFPDKENLEKKSAANLFDQIPTGNNVPHFMHNAEDAYSFSSARCLQALCAIPFYEKHKRGKKVTTGINGTPPIYFLFNGKSLFNTLVFSMTSKAQYSENSFGLPLWRDVNRFDGNLEVTPAFIHGLFSAPLRIQLFISDKGYVKEIAMEEGRDYKSTFWTDPNVVYITNKKNERATLKAKNGRAVWRDLPVIIGTEALKIMFNWKNRDLNIQTFELISFVKYCELKGTVFMAVAQFTEELKIPTVLLSDELKRDSFTRAVAISDELSKECGDALKRTQRQLSGNGSKDEVNPFARVLPQIFSEVFLSEIRETFDQGLTNKLIVADTDTSVWEKEINSYLSKVFRDAVFTGLNKAFDTVSDENIDILVLKNKLRNNAVKKMNYLLKKGGYVDDNG